MLHKRHEYSSLMFGTVKDNDDPLQMGRLKVYIPAIDSEFYKTDDLPWVNYISPFGGTTRGIKVGREETEVKNYTSYGMWAIPKVGAQVIVCCINGDVNVRFWLGCIYLPEYNRTLPQALNDPNTQELRSELDDDQSYEGYENQEKYPDVKIDHYDKNLKEAGLGPQDANFKTRGWERSVSYPRNRVKREDKQLDDGYATKPNSPNERESQIYSWTTPGRHYFTMSDVPDHCRMRFKTTEGQQIILDDTNERIYISTAKGRNWIEIDEDGRIFVYAKDEINIRSEDNINIKSEKDINIRAKKKLNLHSEDDEVNVQAKKHVFVKSTDDKISFDSKSGFNVKVQQGPMKFDSQKDIDMCSNQGKITIFSQNEFNVRSDNNIKLTTNASLDLRAKVTKLSVETSFFISAPANIVIDCKLFTGTVPKALSAIRAQKGEDVSDIKFEMVEPEKESWSRPDSKQSRNKNWKA
jgi:hypothetical protein